MIIYQQNLTIFPPFEDILKDSSLDSYDFLMRGVIGESISFEEGAEVRKFSVKNGEITHTFYLKRNWKQPPLNWIGKKILRGKTQHSVSYLELIAINLLREHNFPVMKPIAWGERRILTIPVEGFLLIEEVPGKSAESYWLLNDPQTRLRLMRDIGTLLGKLHVAGFFAWVRLKDIICSDIPSDPEKPIPLTLIDRECSPDRLQKFTPKNCYKCLAECCGYLLQLNPTATRREIAIFIRSYLKQTQTMGLTSRKKLVSEVRKNLYELSQQPGPPFNYLNTILDQSRL